VWIQVRTVPSRIVADSAGHIGATDWPSAGEALADRILDQLETYAPGLGAVIRQRVVLTPDDLQRENVNLVGGDSLAGSHHVAQNFLFRPWAGGSTYDTVVPSLYVAGASTWPGAGTNALSGYLVAQRLLGKRRRRPRRSRTSSSR
jgi:phytoene dehydrogenase-like protein